MFDLSNITLAFQASHDAASMFDAMTADMLSWHAADTYPSNQDLIAALVAADRWGAATCKVYASNLLSWARSGQTPKTIYQVVNGKPAGHVKGKGGRPAGKGKGKTTKPAEDKAQADAPTVPNNDRSWIDFLRQIQAQAPARKDWTAEDIRAVQDLTGTLIALVKRYAK